LPARRGDRLGEQTNQDSDSGTQGQAKWHVGTSQERSDKAETSADARCQANAHTSWAGLLDLLQARTRLSSHETLRRERPQARARSSSPSRSGPYLSRTTNFWSFATGVYPWSESRRSIAPVAPRGDHQI